MYQSYPTDAEMQVRPGPPVPRSVVNAVKVMYVGALTNIVAIIIDVVSASASMRAFEKRFPNLSVSQHGLVAGFIFGGLIDAAVWIAVARSCRRGRNGARVTGTVLFGVATLETLITVAGAVPDAGPARAWSPVIWLVGAAAVWLLWRPASSAFFKPQGSRPRWNAAA